jgi:hypothetical protein
MFIYLSIFFIAGDQTQAFVHTKQRMLLNLDCRGVLRNLHKWCLSVCLSLSLSLSLSVLAVLF